ncbi:MAG TPA: hypothetical protein VN696_12400 [Pyrinomonadaceae bacterium]|nr:hypothetical protein [Pyrinomonadaceae bacterium]
MRLPLALISFLFLAAFALPLARPAAALQDHTYSSPKVDYLVEFPSPMWKLVDEPDEVHQHAEFVYNDRNDGYLRIRKETLPDGVSVEEFARQDQEQKEHFRPGYIDGKGERFAGRMNGFTMAFEFTQAGKPMAGRTYYLQSGDRAIYALRFTGVRDKLAHIRNQTDQIARTFKLKS